MRLSVTTLGSPDWPLAKVFSEAKRLGYEGVELRCLHGRLLGPDMAPEDRAAAKRLARESGLPIVALGASSAFSSPDPAVRAAQEEDLRGMLEVAAELDAPMVRAYGGGFPRAYTQDAARAYGGSLPAGIDPEVVCAYIAESLDRIAPRAEELGVLIVIETHDGLSSARLLADMLGRVRSRQVQALWDVMHPTRMGESPQQVWEHIGARVRHVHFKDARRDAAGRWRAAPAGEGEVPLLECLRVLRAGGYAGWLTLEWEKYWERDIAEPEAAFPHMIATARRLLAEA